MSIFVVYSFFFFWFLGDFCKSTDNKIKGLVEEGCHACSFNLMPQKIGYKGKHPNHLEGGAICNVNNFAALSLFFFLALVLVTFCQEWRLIHLRCTNLTLVLS